MCSRILLLRQFLTNMPGAELLKWVLASELKPVLRLGVHFLASNELAAKNKQERIHVPVHLRVTLS